MTRNERITRLLANMSIIYAAPPGLQKLCDESRDILAMPSPNAELNHRMRNFVINIANMQHGDKHDVLGDAKRLRDDILALENPDLKIAREWLKTRPGWVGNDQIIADVDNGHHDQNIHMISFMEGMKAARETKTSDNHESGFRVGIPPK